MITLIISVYNQPLMIARQMEEIEKYPEGMKVIVVDDGSKEIPEVLPEVDLYRIEIDQPWNRGQARNIGAYVCETEWLIQVDTDHILPAECIEPLLAFEADPLHWYRFPRFRVGRADETRKKDKLHHMKKFGRIHEHIDSYLMTRAMFMTSPYDEFFSGCLGGGSPFLARMTQIHEKPLMLPDDIHLHVHTRHSVADASIIGLSRDREEYSKRRKQRADCAPTEILMHPWHKVDHA